MGRPTPGRAGARSQEPAAGFRLAPGFRAGAVACGLKASGALDLALVVADGPCSAAGVFTTNAVQAAPVHYDREILARHAHEIRAVVANSGCANACTGARGMSDARRMAALAARAVGCRDHQVLVLSTGVIGRPLEMEKVERGIAHAASSLTEADALPAARAILTTDTTEKLAGEEAALESGRIAIRGFAMGSGMIHPHMATMLAVLTTDAQAESEALAGALRAAVARSFNRVSVDGDMSTNDTVLLLASGRSGVGIGGGGQEAFAEALTRCCISLARAIARDGEGATRLVEITVTGARDERQAHQVADAIGRSALVKTAIHGGDPNWGRILAAAGASGAAIDPAGLDLWFGSAGIEVVAAGAPAAFDERAAAAALREDPVVIRVGLGLGAAEATVWTCDLSADYVAINAHYTT